MFGLILTIPRPFLGPLPPWRRHRGYCSCRLGVSPSRGAAAAADTGHMREPPTPTAQPELLPRTPGACGQSSRRADAISPRAVDGAKTQNLSGSPACPSSFSSSKDRTSSVTSQGTKQVTCSPFCRRFIYFYNFASFSCQTRQLILMMLSL